MPGEAADGAESTPVLRTLADKVNWLIDRAHPAGRGPYTYGEVADAITEAAGADSKGISASAIQQLRTGAKANPPFCWRKRPGRVMWKTKAGGCARTVSGFGRT